MLKGTSRINRTELKYVPDGMYGVSAKRMAWLLEQVPPTEVDDFTNAYETMPLKEVMEMYGGLHYDDVYILMNHYHIPYKVPNGSEALRKTSSRKGHHTPKRDFNTEDIVVEDYPIAKAEAKAAVANQQNVNITVPEIDYDKLAEKIVYHMARNILKGYING